jgi:hypothetical protein
MLRSSGFGPFVRFALVAVLVSTIGRACPKARLDGVVIEPMTTRPRTTAMIDIIDISPALTPNIAVWPGDTPLTREVIGYEIEPMAVG